ncbi:MAG: TatD family hydrolase [Spirochaetota bacterium]|nr:MAG: TatD family hydrolase [Spirochaetota bacterium]
MVMVAGNKLIDVHTHLEQYTSKELEAVLNNALNAKIGWIITSGMDLETSTRAVEIASEHTQVLASVGIHPWSAADTQQRDPDQDLYKKLKTLSHHKKVVAIGEVGLDFIDNVSTGVTFHDNSELQKSQQIIFKQYVELACELHIPLIIHARGANRTIISILKDRKTHIAGGIIHNFDGDERQARELLDIGFYLSFGGVITYPDAYQLHDTLRKIPLSGIVTETDSPYIPLYQQTAAKNEPCNINRIVKVIAKLKRMNPERLIEIIHSNFRTLFDISDMESSR